MYENKKGWKRSGVRVCVCVCVKNMECSSNLNIICLKQTYGEDFMILSFTDRHNNIHLCNAHQNALSREIQTVKINEIRVY